jgi:tetratricopeptide (TPR) repeat protein
MSRNDKGAAPSRKGEPPKDAEAGAQFPFWKKALILLAPTVIFFAALELVLALCGVKPLLYEEDPYVGFSSSVPLFVEKTPASGAAAMVTAENRRTYFNLQEFPRQKARNAYRIFCMGGSTTYGRPYTDQTSFCGWLRAMLPQCDPSRKWELVNAGGVSYASYRVAKLMEELTAYEPDLFIIYTGHNEFLEERSYAPVKEISPALRELTAAVCRTRTGTVARRAVGALVGGGPGKTTVERALLPAEVNTILERSLGPEAYHRDTALKELVVAQFRHNLNRMVDIAHSVGADVVFVTPASNLGDCSPFKSEHLDGLSEGDGARWDALLDQANTAGAEGRWDEALVALDEAATIDACYAQMHYLRGQALLHLERYDEARTAFIRARDEDVCPLRAVTPLVDGVRQTAKERGIPVVDFAATAEDESEHGIPGETLFLDHVHCTIDGYRQIALALMDTMAQDGIVHPSATWDDAAIAKVKQEVEGSLDAEAHGVALRNLAMVFNWAGKTEEAAQIAARASKVAGGDAMSHAQLAMSSARAGRTAEAITEFNRALELDPDSPDAHFGLAEIFSQQGEYDKAIGHYEHTLRIQPNHAPAYCNMGIAFAAQGRLEQAIACFQRAISCETGSPPAHYHLAQALTKLGKIDESIQHYREAVKVKPYSESPRIHFTLGRTLLAIGRYDEASVSLGEAVRLAPPDVPAPAARLAWVLAAHPDASKRKPRQALELAQRADQATGHKSPAMLDTLAVAYAAAGDFPNAVGTAQKALDIAKAVGSDRAKELAERLALFERGKPYVLPTR